MSRRRNTNGAYSISGRGVDTSSVSLGAAISKAQTLAGRVQRDLLPDEPVRSIYIRKLGEEAIARIDVRADVIETFTLSR